LDCLPIVVRDLQEADVFITLNPIIAAPKTILMEKKKVSHLCAESQF
jgi:hypothetical protein